MTVCELLDNYDPAVRPSGKMPTKDQSELFVFEVQFTISLRFFVIVIAEKFETIKKKLE